MNLEIAPTDPTVADVRELLARHLAFAREVTPHAYVHALDETAALDQAVTFFAGRIDGELVVVAALKQLDEAHAELKSMHTVEAFRGMGIGRAMVDHLLAAAADQHYRRLSLETGTMDAFAPARSLYEKAGFVPCEPFGEYGSSPTSKCMTTTLGPADRRERSID